MEPSAIVTIGMYQYHMMGEHAAVVFKTKPIKKTITQDGIEYVGVYYGPDLDHQPYIDLITIYSDNQNGDLYIEEDSPVEGGMQADYAEKIARELIDAAMYLREKTNHA